MEFIFTRADREEVGRVLGIESGHQNYDTIFACFQ
jgi:hypothetical protein